VSRSLPDCLAVPFSWGVVVPVKRLSVAKTRLASYGDEVRQQLALAFAADVVTVALQAPTVRHVLVVTDDERATELLVALGATSAADDPDDGLNPALVHGADLLRRRDPGLGIVTLSADLPALRPQDLSDVLTLVEPGRRGFVADSGATGTTLLAAGPGANLLPAYGARSREQHLRSGARELPAPEGLRRDVDTPADLELAVRLGVGAHTSRVLRRLR